MSIIAIKAKSSILIIKKTRTPTLKVVATSRKLYLELKAIKLELRIFLFHLKILPGSKVISIFVIIFFRRTPGFLKFGFKPKTEQNFGLYKTNNIHNKTDVYIQ